MLLARCTFTRRGPKPEQPAAINRVAVTQGTVLSLIADGGATSLNLGGEHWRDGIKDRYNLALRSWIGSAGFDRDEDFGRNVGRACVGFAASEKRDWLPATGHGIYPVVGSARVARSPATNCCSSIKSKRRSRCAEREIKNPCVNKRW